MSAYIISCATPTLRRNVDLPPALAPVITSSGTPSASTSLPTTRSSRRRLRRGVVEAAAAQGGRSSGQSCGEGEAERLLPGRKPLMEVQAAHVEAELGAVPLE